jgi:hypothetical protein
MLFATPNRTTKALLGARRATFEIHSLHFVKVKAILGTTRLLPTKLVGYQYNQLLGIIRIDREMAMLEKSLENSDVKSLVWAQGIDIIQDLRL